jgi:hypothetical protein
VNFRSRRKAKPKDIPPYGVLIGRMIFIGGIIATCIGVGFFVVLGITRGSLLSLLIFGVLALAGIAATFLAVRDLTGQPVVQQGVVSGKNKHVAGGNPNYELKINLLNVALSPRTTEISYNVTEQDFARFEVGDKVAVRYSAHFKLLVDIKHS